MEEKMNSKKIVRRIEKWEDFYRHWVEGDTSERGDAYLKSMGISEVGQHIDEKQILIAQGILLNRISNDISEIFRALKIYGLLHENDDVNNYNNNLIDKLVKERIEEEEETKINKEKRRSEKLAKKQEEG